MSEKGKPWARDWYVHRAQMLKDETPEEYPVCGIRTEPDGRGKCIVETDYGNYPPDLPEAHLIAAAPALYRALDEFVDDWEQATGMVADPKVDDMAGRAAAALRKARGE